jgi:hypothetical protein
VASRRPSVDSRSGNREPTRPPAIMLIMTREQAVSPFGARLRQWRTHQGISQLALAAAAAGTQPAAPRGWARRRLSGGRPVRPGPGTLPGCTGNPAARPPALPGAGRRPALDRRAGQPG